MTSKSKTGRETERELHLRIINLNFVYWERKVCFLQVRKLSESRLLLTRETTWTNQSAAEHRLSLLVGSELLWPSRFTEDEKMDKNKNSNESNAPCFSVNSTKIQNHFLQFYPLCHEVVSETMRENNVRIWWALTNQEKLLLSSLLLLYWLLFLQETQNMLTSSVMS